MGVKHFFNKSLVVSRLKTTSGVKQNFTTTATVDASVQHLDARSITELGLQQDRAWIMFIAIEDVDSVQDGDKIVVDEAEYKLVEKNIVDFGLNQHVELIMERYSKDA